MTKEEQINDKACELAKKYFPDEDNIWARGNIEATKVKLACLEMAKYLQEEQWISVEDELPKKENGYLVSDGTGVLFGYWVDGFWMPSELSGDITHWMPLPNPPKKGD